jgi:hypothetical protein
MIVNGYSTCSQPTGQARIDVTVFQFSGGFPTAQGSTTINCGTGLGSWAVTLTTHSLNPWLSGTLVFGSATLTRDGVEEASTCTCVVAW